MRQVPQYLIIGRGRLAKHFAHYFNQLGFYPKIWHRGLECSVTPYLEKADVVMLLIDDHAIEPFFQKHRQHPVTFVHCSGALTIQGTVALHPLMSFAESLYELDVYSNIPFMVDIEVDMAARLFPMFDNPFYKIDGVDRALYHALCVLAGNFTVIVWQKFFNEMQHRYGVVQSDLTPYLRQIFENVLTAPHAALTGPLARQDEATIALNIKALEGDPFQSVYQAMVQAYYEEQAHAVD